MSERIHGIAWAGQPDLKIRCTGEWTTPAWGASPFGNRVTDIEGTHWATSGKVYTFDPDKVTCEACRVARAEEPGR